MVQLDDYLQVGRLSEEEHHKLRSWKKARPIAIDQRRRKDERKT